MNVTVVLNSGDTQSPDPIVNELCTEEFLGILLGKEYIFNEAYDKKIYDVTLPLRKHLEGSDLVAVLDASVGESFVSRVRSFQLTANIDDTGDFTLSCSLELERSVDNV